MRRPRQIPRIPKRPFADHSTEEVLEVLELDDGDGDTDSSAVVMTARRRVPEVKKPRVPPTRTTRPRTRGGSRMGDKELVPAVFEEMVAEAVAASPSLLEEPDRPQKRRRVGQRPGGVSEKGSEKGQSTHAGTIEGSASVRFEDVLLEKAQQTVYNDSDSESEESDIDWEEVGMVGKSKSAAPADTSANDNLGNLELNLDVNKPPQRAVPVRRTAITKAERQYRLWIHQLNLLLLLAHVDLRNKWINDDIVQKSLKPLLTKDMLKYLNPASTLPPFGQANSLKRGLELVNNMWRSRFKITARGHRTPLWAENEEDIQNVCSIASTSKLSAAGNLASDRLFSRSNLLKIPTHPC